MGAASALPDYWVDTSVLDEGMKGPYGFDIAPRFWTMLDELCADGRIACPLLVYDELQGSVEIMAHWARERRDSGLFVEPDENVQTIYRDVVNYVADQYPDNQSRRRFLEGVDPWLIAHAIVTGGKVVTLEQRVDNNSKQARIPNVCAHFGVEWITTYQMLRELGVSWTR